MAYHACNHFKIQSCQKILLLHSTFISLDRTRPSLTTTHREQKEHQIFKQLLQLVPDLEPRLIEGSYEDIRHVAELVCVYSISVFTRKIYEVQRYRRAPPAQDRMIPRVLKVLLLTGSLRRMGLWTLH